MRFELRRHLLTIPMEPPGGRNGRGCAADDAVSGEVLWSLWLTVARDVVRLGDHNTRYCCEELCRGRRIGKPTQTYSDVDGRPDEILLLIPKLEFDA